MNSIAQLQNTFLEYLISTFQIPSDSAHHCTLALNVDENKQAFGDLNSSAALVLSKQLKQKPRDIAQEIATHFKDERIEKIEIAGPGFLNIFLTQKAFDQLAQELLAQKQKFFKPSNASHKKINIEFVSANPTGPLHFGHGRGGIIGDVLANVLSFMGHQVTKEFYINDAGSQIEKLGNSLKIRYQQLCGMKVDLPDDAYHGTYLIDLANDLKTTHGEHLLDQPTQFFAEYGKTELLKWITKTLHDYGITFDVWFSERKLHDGAIEKAIKQLKKDDHLYEKDGALWFKSTDFGDDKDRVVRKKDGSLTYAAADIAYMQDKIKRGNDELIFVLGHDHHSYATRLKGLRDALGLQNHPLDVILYQLVRISEDGEQVRMSKRAGKIVSLQDIIDTVGKDVARFFYLNRKADAQLEFDLNLALTRSDANPVFYIQYAYVRTGSILHNAQDHKELSHIQSNDLNNLSSEDDFLIKKVLQLKEMLEVIGSTHQTHLLAYYTYELAQAFNRYYNKNRVIEIENIPLSRARLALIVIMRDTLGLCLDLLGISKPEKM